jgi:hypothetical protein
MKPSPITTIKELLGYDVPYPAFTPVILFNRSLWQKFVGLRWRKS